MSELDEAGAVALLTRLFAKARGPGGALELGIGDDAAVIRIGKQRLVWTVDAAVEGVHFDRRWLALSDVGWRSFQAAASDLAAMAARPLAALSSLVLPRGFPRAELSELARGQAEAARDVGCPIAGGNLARGSELGVTTTLIGLSERPLLRSGARPGDELWLVGELGLARAGLLLCQRKQRGRSRPAERALSAWRRPRALIARGLSLAGRARALIDVSDGLSGDARHLADGSGVRVVVESAALERALSAELSAVARQLGQSALALALEGGEDYALVASGPREKRPRFARAIGRIERGRGAFLERGSELVPLGAGFDHLR